MTRSRVTERSRRDGPTAGCPLPHRALAVVVGGDGDGHQGLEVKLLGAVGVQRLGRSVAQAKRSMPSRVWWHLYPVMSGKGDADSARTGGNNVSGEGSMSQDSFWKNNPDLMMTRAKELGRLVEHLDAERRDGAWREGTSVAVPVLLSLAVEIGLKAWHRSEGKRSHVKTHDLLVLFDGLGENTRKLLEDRMPEVAGPMPDWPIYPGIRNALRQNNNVFTEWRYAHEHDALFAETGVLKAALAAIVEAYFVRGLRRPVLGR